MKLLISTLLLFSFITAKAQRGNYIDHPSSKDTLCIKEVARAKKDLAAGQLNYCECPGWNIPYSRMFPELDSLCKTYGLIFTPGTWVERDVIYEGDPNTYTCYSDFMDREIANRFGSEFKNKLMKQAHSIFIAKSFKRTIGGYECDVSPRSIDGLECQFFSMFRFPDNCPMQTNCKDCDIRVDFVVDTTGHRSNFSFMYSEKFPLDDSCKKIYQDRILWTFEITCDKKCWVPGQMANRKVISTVGCMIDLINHRIR